MWGSDDDHREFGKIYPMWYGDAAVRDRRAAVAKLRSQAERNYAPAQFALAMAYFDGDGVRRDYQQAYQYAVAAAEQGYPSAENMVGGFHASATPKHDACAHDPATAAQWYRKAAEHGNAGAMMNLVNAYQTGSGVAADPVEVFVWASLAVHCSPIRNRGAETIRDRVGAALDPQQRAGAEERIAQLRSGLPHPWSEAMLYWRSLSEQ
jgi:hypothetical protein